MKVSTQPLSLADRVWIITMLAAVLAWTFPHLSVAQTIPEEPFVFEIKSAPTQIFSETDSVVDPRVERLREYLKSKNSPMADYTDLLLAQYHYKFIIGISFAESNFCKQNIRPHNCWGIGGDTPEVYKNYPEAFARANELIQKYQDSGLTNATLMRNRWVGWKNDSWTVAVNTAIGQLAEQGL